MTLFRRYTTSTLTSLLDDILSYSSVPSLDFPTTLTYRRDRWFPVNETTVNLEVELPGFSREQIEVYTENHNLVVSAKDTSKTNSRSFFKTWNLGEHEVIGKVKLENGLLVVEISKVVPEEKKRHLYKIE